MKEKTFSEKTSKDLELELSNEIDGCCNYYPEEINFEEELSTDDS